MDEMIETCVGWFLFELFGDVVEECAPFRSVAERLGEGRRWENELER